MLRANDVQKIVSSVVGEKFNEILARTSFGGGAATPANGVIIRKLDRVLLELSEFRKDVDRIKAALKGKDADALWEFTAAQDFAVAQDAGSITEVKPNPMPAYKLEAGYFGSNDAASPDEAEEVPADLPGDEPDPDEASEPETDVT